MGGIAAVFGTTPPPYLDEILGEMLSLSDFRGKASCITLARAALSAQQSCGEGHLLSDCKQTTLLNGYIRTEGGAATAGALETIHSMPWNDAVSNRVGELDGEFSIIHHDAPSSRVFVACSLFGTRPLFFRQLHELTLIGTDIRQLFPRQLKDKPSIDEDRLIEYLHFQQVVSEPDRTYYQDIRRITPGYIYTFNTLRPAQAPRRVAFWFPPKAEPAEKRSVVIQAAEELRELIKESLFGSLSAEATHLSLSGGMDSSTLWSLLQAAEEPRTSRIKAASHVFPGQKCDESVYLDALEKRYKAEITRIDHSDMRSGAYIEQLTDMLDYLIWPNTYYIERFIPELARRNNKIVMLGYGGDELLSPGIAYLADDIEHGRWLSSVYRALTYRPAGASRFDMVWAIKRFLTIAVYPSNTLPGKILRKLKPAHAPRWAHPGRRELLDKTIGQYYEGSRAKGHARNRILATVAWHGNIGIAPYEQRAALAGQIIRNPYLSKKILDFSLRTPPRIHLPWGKREKELLRVAGKGLVPNEIRERRVATEFGTKETLDPLLVTRLGPVSAWELSKRSIIDPGFIKLACDQLDDNGSLSSWLAFVGCAESFLRKHSYH